MESFKWLIMKNNEKIRMKCMIYAVALSTFFIAFQQNYGLVPTNCMIFTSLLIIYNRVIYHSFIENGVVVLIIYKDLHRVISIFNREAIIKSLKALIFAIPITMLHNFIAIHENFAKPVYRVFIDAIIFLVISILLSSLHTYLLFMVSINSNKFADVLFLFISTLIYTVYRINIEYLIGCYLMFIIALIAVLVFAKKRISKERLMLM